MLAILLAPEYSLCGFVYVCQCVFLNVFLLTFVLKVKLFSVTLIERLQLLLREYTAACRDIFTQMHTRTHTLVYPHQAD